MVNNNELKTKIIEEVDKAPIPISTQSIVRKLGISWNRANCLLLSLAAEEKVAGIPTQLGWVFMSRKRVKIDKVPLPEKEPESPPQQP